jgi:hypothetical protein
MEETIEELPRMADFCVYGAFFIKAMGLDEIHKNKLNINFVLVIFIKFRYLCFFGMIQFITIFIILSQNYHRFFFFFFFSKIYII